jgi:hypothetical protein
MSFCSTTLAIMLVNFCLLTWTTVLDIFYLKLLDNLNDTMTKAPNLYYDLLKKQRCTALIVDKNESLS